MSTTQEPLTRVDQATKPTTAYTVLMRTMRTVELDREHRGSVEEAPWLPLAVIEATSQQQARRRALETDQGQVLVELVKAKTHRVWTVAVATFDPAPLLVEQPPPPPPKIRC